MRMEIIGTYTVHHFMAVQKNNLAPSQFKCGGARATLAQTDLHNWI